MGGGGDEGVWGPSGAGKPGHPGSDPGHPEGCFEGVLPKDLNRRTCRAVARDPSGEKLRRSLQDDPHAVRARGEEVMRRVREVGRWEALGGRRETGKRKDLTTENTGSTEEEG